MPSSESGAPPVEERSAPVAPSPDAGPDATPRPDVDHLQRKLELVQSDKQRLGETNAKLNARLQELEERLKATESQLQSGKASQLEQSGEYKQLWEDAKATIASKDDEINALRRDLDTVRETANTERLRSNAMREIATAEANAPDQLLALLQPHLREVEGKPIVLNGGMEIPLPEYLSRLKAPDSGWEHHFAPRGARGMGARASAPVGTPAPGANPFVTRNLTEQARLWREDRAAYDRLKAEAQRGG
jgi:hypothetical protein